MWDLEFSTNKLLVSKAARDELEHTFIMMFYQAGAWVRVRSCTKMRKMFIDYTT